MWYMCFPGSSASKEFVCNSGDPGSASSPGEGTGYPLQYSLATLVSQVVKNLPTMWETWIWSLVWEDPLENGMAAHSSIFAWRIPWTESPGRLQSMGSQRVGHDWATITHSLMIHILMIYIGTKTIWPQADSPFLNITISVLTIPLIPSTLVKNCIF